MKPFTAYRVSVVIFGVAVALLAAGVTILLTSATAKYPTYVALPLILWYSVTVAYGAVAAIKAVQARINRENP